MTAPRKAKAAAKTAARQQAADLPPQARSAFGQLAISQLTRPDAKPPEHVQQPPEVPPVIASAYVAAREAGSRLFHSLETFQAALLRFSANVAHIKRRPGQTLRDREKEIAGLANRQFDAATYRRGRESAGARKPNAPLVIMEHWDAIKEPTRACRPLAGMSLTRDELTAILDFRRALMEWKQFKGQQGVLDYFAASHRKVVYAEGVEKRRKTQEAHEQAKATSGAVRMRKTHRDQIVVELIKAEYLADRTAGNLNRLLRKLRKEHGICIKRGTFYRIGREAGVIGSDAAS